MRIHLLRHGNTPLSGAFTGSTDVSLNKQGRRQILEKSAGLRQISFDKCFCSPMKRCLESFELLGCGCDFEVQSEIKEIDFGTWDGLNFSEIQERDESNLELWFQKKEEFTFPDGDNILEFYRKISDWFQSLVTMPFKEVLVVTHGGVIRYGLCSILTLGISRADSLKIDEGSLSIIRMGEDYASLEKLNC